jgi:hypothetical protein
MDAKQPSTDRSNLGSLPAQILEGLGAKLELEKWGEGVYLLNPTLKAGMIVIHQLPQTPTTLSVRPLGNAKCLDLSQISISFF